MLYVVCKAKNGIASNEQEPKFNPNNWEVIETVNCRKNATVSNWHSAFYPIYESFRLSNIDTHYRLWNFKVSEL